MAGPYYPLQYPNTTAAYLAVISLLAITLVTVEKLSIRVIYTLHLCNDVGHLMYLIQRAWLIFAIGAIAISSHAD